MYIPISKKPSKEEIAKFSMKVVEEDSVIDYRVELASLDKKAKEELCEYYNLTPERIESINRITFSFTQEV